MAPGPAKPDRIRWLDVEGERVLLVDLSYCPHFKVEELIRNAGQVIRSQPLGSTLVLADFTQAEVDLRLVALIKEVAALDQPHVKGSAWVGGESLSELWHAAIERVSNRKFYRFETRGEALRFLL